MFSFSGNVEKIVEGNKEHLKSLVELISNMKEYAEYAERVIIFLIFQANDPNDEEYKQNEKNINNLEEGLKEVLIMKYQTQKQINGLMYLKELNVKL